MSYPPGPPQEGEPKPREPYPGGQQPGYGPHDSGQPGYGQPRYPPPQPAWGYPAEPGYGHQLTPTNNGKAIASLITGISALVLALCSCGLGGVVGIVAVFLGFAGRANIKASGGRESGEGMALGGIITGILATLIALAAIAFFAVVIATGNTDFTTFPSDPYNRDF